MKAILAYFFLALSMLIPGIANAGEQATKTAVVQLIKQETRNQVSDATIRRIVNATFREAEKQNLDPFLLLSVFDTESKFRPNAKNKSGARGLGQVIPRWHREKIRGRNIMHIETNVEVSAMVLAEYLNSANQNIAKAVRKYSGGARNYKQKLQAFYAKAKQADILHRFENELPIAVTARFDRPSDFNIVSTPVLVAKRHPLDYDI